MHYRVKVFTLYSVFAASNYKVLHPSVKTAANGLPSGVRGFFIFSIKAKLNLDITAPD